jgi:DNA-binding NtrC family response regulator
MELTEHLLKTRPKLKVLMMSGYTDEVLAQFRESMEGLALMEKPFTPTQLLQRVRELLDR